MDSSDGEVFYLKEGVVELDTENEYNFKEVNIPEDAALLSSDGEEDYETVQQQIELLSSVQPSHTPPPGEEPTIKVKPQPIKTSGEVIEDFVRNFLVSMGLKRTAHSFQTEWYELSLSGQLGDQYKHTVSDIYTQNRILQEKLEDLETQLHGYKEAAKLAKEKYMHLRKERDYHRMHHRRTLQEKERLMTDMKRMKSHFTSYDPMLKDLRKKYEAATREKLLTSLERDKAIAEVECLQSTLHSLRPSTYPPNELSSKPVQSQPLPPINTANKPSISSIQPNDNKILKSLPAEPANPYCHSMTLPLCAHLTRVSGLQLTGTIDAHDFSISCLALHPTKNILVTGSDDHTWKMWTVPSGEHLMTGEGHEDWLSSIQFHPSGDVLASTSGDGTVKIWNLSQLTSTLTLPDHRQPIWGCSWHWSGQILASAGMDHCCKLWDIESGQCVLTLRGHADSINAVQFLPYSNTIATCSADKTVSLWDARTGLCLQTYYDHQNACNDVMANYQRSELYSADCFGIVIKWDLKGNACVAHWDLGPYPVNGLAIDQAGSVLACSSGSGTVCLVEQSSGKVSNLDCKDVGSTEAVCYGHNADTLYSVGANGSIGVWQ